MEHFNKLATRKEIGAIKYRIRETSLDPKLRRTIIDRHLDNLLDTLPESFHLDVLCCFFANRDSQLIALCRILDKILARIPLTYGEIPAGTVFHFQNYYVTKRKDGIEYDGEIYPHVHAKYEIRLVSGD